MEITIKIDATTLKELFSFLFKQEVEPILNEVELEKNLIQTVKEGVESPLFRKRC